VQKKEMSIVFHANSVLGLIVDASVREIWELRFTFAKFVTKNPWQEGEQTCPGRVCGDSDARFLRGSEKISELVFSDIPLIVRHLEIVPTEDGQVISLRPNSELLARGRIKIQAAECVAANHAAARSGLSRASQVPIQINFRFEI